MIRHAPAIAALIVCASLSACGPGEGQASSSATSTEVRPRSPRFDRVIDMLRSEGFAVADPQGELSPDCKRQVDQFNRHASTVAPQVFLIDQSLHVILAQHFEAFEPVAYVESPRVFMVVDDIDLIPTDGSTAVWQQAVSKLHDRGARYVERDRNKLTDVLGAVDLVRLQITEHQIYYNSMADLSQGWQDLIRPESLLRRPPVNPLAPKEVASQLIVIDVPGETGAKVSLKLAGWVWNRADSRFFPAGWTEEQLKNALDQIKGPGFFSDRRRGTVKGILGGFRGGIANYWNLTGLPDQRRYPTADEINTGKVTRLGVERLTNPFNGSATVQAATWQPEDPLVRGTAGWNYDQQTGNIWANSDVTGENEF